jgi:hypothetical protein
MTTSVAASVAQAKAVKRGLVVGVMARRVVYPSPEILAIVEDPAWPLASAARPPYPPRG